MAALQLEREVPPLPKGLLVAWYGDDFTGAAAVMEVLTFAGLPAALFLEVPTAEQLARFPGLRGVGVASTARAQAPEWMDAVLPGAFDSLAALGPQFLHYKVCSTLDSSPETGSIGRAMEIGADRMRSRCVPVLVAAPQMRRYQAFGNLFAAAGERVERLDRHPVMSRHPVTPMTESDVARHISRQSAGLQTRVLTLEGLAAGQGLRPQGDRQDCLTAVIIDSIDAASEAAAGRAIWQARAACPFVVGSQGVEYALVAHWRQTGGLTATAPASGIGPARMVTVSGSVSSTTADQIAWSAENGFACLEFDAAQVCRGAAATEAEIGRMVRTALDAMAQGRDPLIYTAAGPDDPAVGRFRDAVAASGLNTGQANRQLGEALGQVLTRVLLQGAVRRAVVSGGDTSGFATRQLGFYALTALAPTIPGASIFRAHADGPLDGLELALKGGQMGSPDYFGWVRDGGGAR